MVPRDRRPLLEWIRHLVRRFGLAGARLPVLRIDLGPELAAADMLATAGLVQRLDLVVAADTGLIHLVPKQA